MWWIFFDWLYNFQIVLLHYDRRDDAPGKRMANRMKCNKDRYLGWNKGKEGKQDNAQGMMASRTIHWKRLQVVCCIKVPRDMAGMRPSKRAFGPRPGEFK